MSDKSESINSKQIAKDFFGDIWKKKKKLLIALISIILAVAIIVGGVAVIKTDAIYSRIVCSVIPNEMDAVENTGLYFYSERNKDFDSEKDGKDYFKMFKCYYYPENDKSKEKVYLENDGTYYMNNQPVFISMGFLYLANQRLAKIKTAVGIIAGIIAACAVAIVIYFLYKANKKGGASKKKKRS